MTKEKVLEDDNDGDNRIRKEKTNGVEFEARRETTVVNELSAVLQTHCSDRTTQHSTAQIRPSSMASSRQVVTI